MEGADVRPPFARPCGMELEEIAEYWDGEPEAYLDCRDLEWLLLVRAMGRIAKDWWGIEVRGKQTDR